MKLIPKFVMKKNQQIYCVITVVCDDFPSFYDEGKKFLVIYRLLFFTTENEEKSLQLSYFNQENLDSHDITR